jgi:putative hemolysin
MVSSVIWSLGLVAFAGVINCGARALLSSRRNRIEADVEEGLFGSTRALKLIQKGEEIAPQLRVAVTGSIVAFSLLVGPLLYYWVFDLLSHFYLPSSINAAGALVSAVFVVAVGIHALAELVPAEIAARYPEPSARYLSAVLVATLAIVGPLARLLTRLVKGATGCTNEGVSDVDVEDDIRDLVDEAQRAGVIDPGEREIINRVFKLDDKPVASVMTPRAHVSFIRVNTSVHESLLKASEAGHSVLPVVGDSEDEVLGIISVHDLIKLANHPQNYRGGVRELLMQPLQVPESMSALRLLELLRSSDTRFGVVRDEYGGFAGVVTMYDVLQVIVGHIGEGAATEGDIVERGDGSLLVDAGCDVHDLFESLGIKDGIASSASEFRSLGGFVMTTLGYVPKEGERFTAHGYNFEVVDMDNKRIDKVLVWPLVSQKAASV